MFPQTRSPHVGAPVLSSGGTFGAKPAQSPNPDPSSTGSVGGAGSFYKHANKCPVAQLPSDPITVPVKKPAVSVRGKCVAHTEGRFRVEVGYHAELIAVFKSIPSKNYGKCLSCSMMGVCYLSVICVGQFDFHPIKSCSGFLDPATKMWSFSLEDYRLLSMNTRDMFTKARTFSSKSTKCVRCKRVFQVCWLLHVCSACAAVEEASALASVTLRPLEGMNCVDAAAPAHGGAALAALLKLCNGWQKPGAGLQGQCVLVSPKKFEVDIGYSTDVIAAFKQMPTKNYGKRQMIRGFFGCFFCLLDNCFALLHFMVAGILWVFAADMKTRKWSFSLEDYKRLSE